KKRAAARFSYTGFKLTQVFLQSNVRRHSGFHGFVSRARSGFGAEQVIEVRLHSAVERSRILSFNADHFSQSSQSFAFATGYVSSQLVHVVFHKSLSQFQRAIGSFTTQSAGSHTESLVTGSTVGGSSQNVLVPFVGIREHNSSTQTTTSRTVSESHGGSGSENYTCNNFFHGLYPLKAFFKLPAPADITPP